MSFSPVPKTIEGGGGLGNTMSVSFVQKPSGGPSVVFVLMHMSGAATEMPNTPQPNRVFDVFMSYSSWLSTSPACVVRLLLFYTALILDVLLLIFGLEVAKIAV